MLIGRIRGSDTIYKGPADMEDCQDLHVRHDRYADGSVALVSAWIPTPDELARLNAGQPVWLHIWANGQPPVALSVPED